MMAVLHPLGMFIHMVLTASVIFRPMPKPWEWVGEIRTFPPLMTVIFLWALLGAPRTALELWRAVQ